MPGIGPATQYGQNVRVVSDSFKLVTGVETISITYDDFVRFTQEHAVLVRPSGARLTYVRRSSPEAVPLWALEA